MTSPVRVQLRRTAGWRMPPNTVKVTRPLIFGNPFVHPDPAEAVAAYRKLCEGGTKVFEIAPDGLMFAPRIHPNSTHWAFAEWMREEGLPALRGKNLACWCPLDAPCHADVLLDLANRQIVCEAA